MTDTAVVLALLLADCEADAAEADVVVVAAEPLEEAAGAEVVVVADPVEEASVLVVALVVVGTETEPLEAVEAAASVEEALPAAAEPVAEVEAAAVEPAAELLEQYSSIGVIRSAYNANVPSVHSEGASSLSCESTDWQDELVQKTAI